MHGVFTCNRNLHSAQRESFSIHHFVHSFIAGSHAPDKKFPVCRLHPRNEMSLSPSLPQLSPLSAVGVLEHHSLGLVRVEVKGQVLALIHRLSALVIWTVI